MLTSNMICQEVRQQHPKASQSAVRWCSCASVPAQHLPTQGLTCDLMPVAPPRRSSRHLSSYPLAPAAVVYEADDVIATPGAASVAAHNCVWVLPETCMLLLWLSPLVVLPAGLGSRWAVAWSSALTWTQQVVRPRWWWWWSAVPAGRHHRPRHHHLLLEQQQVKQLAQQYWQWQGKHQEARHVLVGCCGCCSCCSAQPRRQSCSNGNAATGRHQPMMALLRCAVCCRPALDGFELERCSPLVACFWVVPGSQSSKSPH